MIGNGAITYDTLVLSLLGELKFNLKISFIFTRIFIAPRVNAKRVVPFHKNALKIVFFSIQTFSQAVYLELTCQPQLS